MHWRIELLGGLRLVPVGGGNSSPAVTHFESRKTAALLAILALSPQRIHPREELCAVLWPDADLAVGRNRLKQALSSLRRIMEPPGIPPGSVLLSDRFALRLCPSAFESDVSAFDKAVRTGQWGCAQEGWRGELLPGFYEDPLLLERERLNALYARLPTGFGSPTNGFLPAPPRDAPSRLSTAAPSRLLLHPLPIPPTPFFGRDEELARLAVLLDAHRWITLTGPGGMGKTRLALESARRFAEGEVRFVDLTEVSDENKLPEVIARTLTLPPLIAAPSDGGDLWDALIQKLAGRSLLLFLDNAEHLVTPSLAERFRRLSDALPHTRLLLTSRVPLGSNAETVFAVGPLPVPAPDADLEAMSGNPVVQMFLERARRVRADMQITPRNSASLKGICRRLEGIPLAVELCAASAHTLAPAQIMERLGAGSSPLLVSGRRDTLERHRSLDGAITTTFSLLSPAQRGLLGSLTVFRGEWTAEMAEAVCPTAQTLFDLTALFEAALLQTRSRETALSFTMLETIRQFAVRLHEGQEMTAIEKRHTDFFRQAAHRFSAERDADETTALEAVDAMQDNLQAVILRALACKDAATVLHLLVDLDGYWQMRGYGREVVGWLETVLVADDAEPSAGSPEQAAAAPTAPLRIAARALCGSLILAYKEYDCADGLLHESLREAVRFNETALEAQALYHLGRLAFLRGNLQESHRLHQSALLLRRQTAGSAAVARSCHALGQIAQKQKDWQAAQAWYREALTSARRTRRPGLIADVLYDTAALAKDRGEFDQSAALLQECEITAQNLRSLRLQAKIANNLGDVHQLRGDVEQARIAFERSAQLFCQLREGAAMHFPLWNLASLAYEEKKVEKSLSLFALAARLWEDVGRPLDEESTSLLQTVRAEARQQVGPVTEGFWWDRGCALSLEESLDTIKR